MLPLILKELTTLKISVKTPVSVAQIHNHFSQPTDTQRSRWTTYLNEITSFKGKQTKEQTIKSIQFYRQINLRQYCQISIFFHLQLILKSRFSLTVCARLSNQISWLLLAGKLSYIISDDVAITLFPANYIWSAEEENEIANHLVWLSHKFCLIFCFHL